MKRIFTLFFMLTLLFSAFSQQSNCPPTVTDRNGNVYNTIWVGGNCWMKENLRSTLYGTQSNADHLQPVYMVYPGATSTMGYLYTWYSAVGLPQGSNATPPTAISERVQGICPNEWAIPSAIQLMSLINSGESREGNTPSYWVYNNGIMPAGTNLFNMVPSGFYNAHLERFVEYNHAGYLWTLNYNGTSSTCGIFPFDCRQPDQMSMNKNSLLSVRCVKAPPYGVEEITACDSITWNGVTRYTTGRYVANLPNDSVSTLLLTVNYTTYYTLPIVACDSYTWDLTGDTYTTSGTDVAVITNALGCDSVVTLDLEVRYSNTGVDVQNHCDSYQWIDGITYTESTNEPTFVVTNAAGCDSTVTLNLTIRKMTTGIDVQNHCDSYQWIDGITYTESTNEPTFVLTNAVGCDSVVTLNLTIRKKTYGIDVQDHCDSYTWINGVTYTESTDTPVYTITNMAGCDSIVTLNLTIRKKTASPSQSLTEYNTYTWNGQTYTTSGIYTATLVNAVGCDSTATLDLTILYRFPITYTVNGGVMPAEYPVTYIQGVGATLPVPTKPNNRFDGWYDNATFTGSPITAISNIESGDRQYYALWTVTQLGQNSSLSFSGSSSAYAQIPDSSYLNPTAAITLEAWIYPTSWRTNIYEGSIISKEIATGNGGYILRCGASGKLSFALGIGTTFVELNTTTNVLTLNQWQHVAGTYDGTTMRIYLNGVEIGNKAQTGPINVSSNRVEIGRNFAYTSRYFTGRIDEVRIFNTALSGPTILNWYNKTVNNTHANYANLVGYYEFDNTSNPLVTYATVGSNGTIATATYVTNCVSPFNTANIGTPSVITASHPLPQYNTIMYPVVAGDTLAQILRVEVKPFMAGNVTQITVSTNGSTNPADISRARLWATGTSTTFSTATPFGSPVMNPNGSITFTGTQAVSCGSTYYFFLTYDINPSAAIGNVLDAELVNATVERLLVTPTVGAPAGNRPVVDPCTAHILQIRDSFGDTWEGGYVSVMKNNDTIFSTIAVTEGPGADRTLYQHWYDYPFTANSGDTIRIIRLNSTGTLGECKFKIMRGSTEIASETTVATPPAINTVVAGCYNVVTATAGSNGTITPSGAFNVYGNRSQTFTATPNQYYYVDSLIINGINNPAAVLAGSYTFSNLTGSQTIRATFKTNYVTPTMITPPTTSIAYEGFAYSTVTLSGGLVQYNGTDIPGTYTWVNPAAIIPGTATFTASVLFTPNVGTNCLPITFNVTGNVTLLSVIAANGTTTSSYIPFEGYNLDGAQHNQMIYPASMLTGLVGKQITSMTFYLSSPPSAAWTAVSTFKIGTTTTTTLTGLITAPSTTVYTGLMPVVSNTVTITFTAPFTYTGDNLIIDFSNVAANWKSATFYGVTQTSASYYTRGTTLTSYSFLPKIKFTYLP